MFAFIKTFMTPRAGANRNSIMRWTLEDFERESSRYKYLSEILLNNPWVHPFYDFDAKEDKEMTQEELESREANAFELFRHLQPDIDNEDLLRAHRNAVWCTDKKEKRRFFKFSFRVFVRGCKIRLADIPRYIEWRAADDDFVAQHKGTIDMNNYNPTERCLCCVDKLKLPKDRRKLIKMDDAPLMDYLVQNVDKDDVDITPPRATKRLRLSPSVPSPPESPRTPDDGDPSVERATTSLRQYLAEKFAVNPELIRVEESKREHGYVTIPTREHNCSIAGRAHGDNHIYFVASEKGAKQKCHNSNCKKSCGRTEHTDQMPEEVKSELHRLLARAPANPTQSDSSAQDDDPNPFFAAVNNALGISEHMKWASAGEEGCVGTKKHCYVYMLAHDKRCLLVPGNEHLSTGCCRLQIFPKARQVTIICEAEGSRDVTNRYHSLLEQHVAYLNAKQSSSEQNPEEGLKDMAIPTRRLFAACGAEGLRRYAGHMYRPLPGKPCCFEKTETYEEFVWRIFTGNEIYISRLQNQADLETAPGQNCSPTEPVVQTGQKLDRSPKRFATYLADCGICPLHGSG